MKRKLVWVVVAVVLILSFHSIGDELGRGFRQLLGY